MDIYHIISYYIYIYFICCIGCIIHDILYTLYCILPIIYYYTFILHFVRYQIVLNILLYTVSYDIPYYVILNDVISFYIQSNHIISYYLILCIYCISYILRIVNFLYCTYLKSTAKLLYIYIYIYLYVCIYIYICIYI